MTTQRSWFEVTDRDRTPVAVWLMGLCAMILLMVTVGGVTRLTDSGLSMVQWQPILGAIPPMNEAEWQERFDQYRQYPEYQELNRGMSLDAFKFIFFWEYFHRLLGRLLGVVFLIPFIVFLIRRAFSVRTAGLLFLALVLGGGQGLMGWYMVQSGLAENPYVSHYRLAAHFGLALVLFGYLFLMLLHVLEIRHTPPAASAAPIRRATWWISGLLGLQILYGAFVAGLNAGFMHNTFPKMTGYWMHPDALAMPGLLANLLDNPVMVQFIHRTLAWVFLFAVAALWWAGRKRLAGMPGLGALHAVGVLTFAQFLLGVLTLITAVPVALGTMHQVLACILLGAFIKLLFDLRPAPAGAAL